MVMRHSKLLLAHLSEVEDKIQFIEHLMEELEIDCDKEILLENLLAKKYGLPFGQPN